MKGVILAGGKGTRLYPITKGINKHLLPIYNKPMIYYPLSVLMLASIRKILIITTDEFLENYKNLLGNGRDFGIDISYAIQKEPKGIAEAFKIGKNFIKNDSVCLILGDNFFYGGGFSEILKEYKSLKEGAVIFAYQVKNPSNFGVIEFDKKIKIKEKPKQPKSKWAITGLYFFDNNVVNYAKNIKPSKRGEVEIVDILNKYLKENKLKYHLLGRGYTWLDMGVYDNLIEAGEFVRTIEKRQGMMIASLEEIALNNRWIEKKDIIKLAKKYNNEYGDYLRGLIE
jgi:glucose-1-phosphate thymidylyltransferase